MNVSVRFNTFISNLKLTAIQRADGVTKHTGVRSVLNSYYYGDSSGYHNSMLVGSWGKSTEIRPPRDIDVLFRLPDSVYYRFEKYSGNKQSAILQEVKSVLQATYSSTKMRGDGQVVVIPFVTQTVELVPAFLLTNGQYWICDTNGGGRYKTIDPNAEKSNIKESNDMSGGNTRDLIRMMKCWQGYCSVPMKSFWIELLAKDFIQQWEYRGKTSVYYDWMVRDFFTYLKDKTYSHVFVPGTWELISLGNAWESKATTAYNRAIKASEYEANECPYLAGAEWQKIFGTQIPTG